MRRFVLLAAISSTMLGCGGLDSFPTAKVTGKVLCDGQPVPDVRISFGPVGEGKKLDTGKAGFATADEEGNYVVATYGENDGAVVGKHNVTVTGPHPEDFPNFSCKCETDPTKVVQQVEVVAGGENDFTINLAPKTAKTAKPKISADELKDIQESTAEDPTEQAKSE